MYLRYIVFIGKPEYYWFHTRIAYVIHNSSFNFHNLQKKNTLNCYLHLHVNSILQNRLLKLTANMCSTTLHENCLQQSATEWNGALSQTAYFITVSTDCIKSHNTLRRSKEDEPQYQISYTSVYGTSQQTDDAFFRSVDRLYRLQCE